MWGLGCILAELLQKVHKKKSTYFFKSKSCFPLSPRRNTKMDEVDQNDILARIMQKTGVPSDEDLSFVTDETAITYVKQLSEETEKSDKKSLHQSFPSANYDLQDLLQGLLSFNPHFRLTAKQALQSKVFDEIRVKHFEKGCTKKII